MNHCISIIVPVFNAAKYLNQCLDSILRQTYTDLQIICVDDGSTDDSAQILLEYAANDDRIIVVRKDNEGVSVARNTALEYATGKYIMFVDGDDWIDPDTCVVAIKAIQRNNADVVMWSYTRETLSESRKKNIFNTDIYFDYSEVKDKLYRRMVGLYGDETSSPENADALCTVWGKLYQRDIIENNHIRFYDIRKIGTYEDGLFNLDVFANARSAVFLNRHLYHYRRENETSLTTKYNEDMPQQWNILFDILKEHIESKCLNSTFHSALSNRIVFSLIALGINEIEKHDNPLKTIARLKKIISNARYQNAIKFFDFRYLPLHWKVFFGFAKFNFAVGVYMLLLIIQKIRGR